MSQTLRKGHRFQGTGLVGYLAEDQGRFTDASGGAKALLHACSGHECLPGDNLSSLRVSVHQITLQSILME